MNLSSTVSIGHASLGRIIFLKYSSRLAHYSTKATANYENFKKLRAYPFRVTPEAARKTMAKVAAPFCSDLGILGTLWRTLIPSPDSFRPVRFSAAYFPAWIVNAEVEADITSGDSRRRGTILFKDCYLPGSHIPTLSAAPLWADDLDHEEPLPCIINQSQLNDRVKENISETELHLFDPSLLKQHGEEVQCIPFTTSPFSLLEIARNLPWSHAVISENFKFAPSSLKVNLFSAYPILLPLYIAMYEMKRGIVPLGTTLTMWTLAHADWSNIMTDNFAVKIDDKRKANVIFKLIEFFINTPADSEVLSFLEPEAQGRVGMIATKKTLGAIEQWLKKASRSSTNISKLVRALDSDDDPRIRPMTTTEKMDLHRYFENEREILLMKRIIGDLKSAGPDAKIITTSLGKPQQGPSSLGTVSAPFQERLDTLLEKKAELKPRWWIEWELIQSQKSAP